jgi:hypothetical protein
MAQYNSIETLRSGYVGGILPLFVAASILLLPTVNAQDLRPLAKLEAIGLDTMKVGRVTAYFSPKDRARAQEMAVMTEQVASFFEQKLGFTFDLGMAALAPEHWFSEFPGIPYAIPWPSMDERLIFMPSSLVEGLLIQGPTALDDRRRVDFVLLHEYGHIAAKEYFRPADNQDYLPVKWFEELLATYFAYAFVHASDSVWAEAAQAAWLDEVESYTPAVLSLDWSFMNDLPGNELARTYGWYQVMLNLRVAEIYNGNGLDFLQSMKEHLPWDEASDWNTTILLALIEEIEPGFEAWEESLPSVYGDQSSDH